MESRSPLYDSRNTVKLSRAGRKNRQRRAEKFGEIKDPAPEDLKLMPFERKVAMSRECRFCGNAFKESRAICPYCLSCQYCGLRPTGSRACEFCGNQDLDKQKVPRKRPKISAEGLHKPRKTKRRTVRRLGPQKRDRRGFTADVAL